MDLSGPALPYPKSMPDIKPRPWHRSIERDTPMYYPGPSKAYLHWWIGQPATEEAFKGKCVLHTSLFLFSATYQDSFWIGAFLAKNKSFNEAIKKTLKLAGIMRTIHNEAVIFQVKLCLSTKFTAKVLCGICNTQKQWSCTLRKRVWACVPKLRFWSAKVLTQSCNTFQKLPFEKPGMNRYPIMKSKGSNVSVNAKYWSVFAGQVS